MLIITAVILFIPCILMSSSIPAKKFLKWFNKKRRGAKTVKKTVDEIIDELPYIGYMRLDYNQ